MAEGGGGRRTSGRGAAALAALVLTVAGCAVPLKAAAEQSAKPEQLPVDGRQVHNEDGSIRLVIFGNCDAAYRYVLTTRIPAVC
ncbi:MAG TPA: hypothetical protein VGB14_04230 [Acidimicrobiales bacterium]|jgi:hypothetical protein